MVFLSVYNSFRLFLYLLTMTLKLYFDLLSQPSRALYIFFKMCNIPFEEQLVNLGKLEHYNPKFEAINPFKKVPVIEHNNFKLTERYYILFKQILYF